MARPRFVGWVLGLPLTAFLLTSLGFGGSVSLGAAPAGTARGVVVTKGLGPLLPRPCVHRHRPNGVAPMSLMTYEDARPWARSMKFRTGLRDKAGAMPPWYIEKNIGVQHFQDDPSLNDQEIAQIAKWADSGAPQGNPADMP